ncbi:MAG TPA: cobyrinic acid a,c-diamide synthase [Prolixibacteraceae bacterium]|nr:cobyrinic acid a,c-diamide synthase [Prolixibacteraceae bacterium]
MKIAIASGKGGTGKTTVSANLYYFINKLVTPEIQLIDCDVEEPNDALFFPDAKMDSEKQVYQLIPEIDTEKCTFCRKCADWCEFNSISIVKNLQFASINPDLCHSCGACIVACEFGAITEHQQPLGVITHFDTGIGKGLTEGRLKIGSAMQTMLIKEVKKNTHDSAEIIIYDAPPGTSCPVVETVANADYIILVTEPTPFGLHDMKITVELLKDLNKPFGVVVNKAGLGNDAVYEFLNENKIDLLGKIPFSKEYAANYASGNILKDIPTAIESIYSEIIEKLFIKTGLK